MRVSTRRPTIIFFIVFGACLTTFAVALNVGWVLLNWRQVALLVFGGVFFVAIIVGLILNTTFLVREIRRNEQHDSFLNSVTHELKTPIASLRLYLETLQTRDVDEARRQEFYAVMLADTDRLLTTVEQVLRANRTSHKRRRAVRQPVNICTLVRECVELARTRHPTLEKDAILLLDAAASSRVASGTTPVGDESSTESAPVVLGDADELRAAVMNLIDNAVKYSPAGVRVTIEVGTDDRKRVVVRVSDEGIGIARDELKSIFKRFHRVPLPIMTRIKGTGLGLFIVRSIVKRHGGQVYAESAGEDAGSTFTMLLPLADPVRLAKFVEAETA